MVYLLSMARKAGAVEPPHEHGDHRHTHGAVDASITTSERGIWAVKWSFVGLFATALVQIVVVLLSGSRRFPFGYGRFEDLAGVIVVLIILFSALVAGYEAIDRLLSPQPVGYLWAVVVASVVGFVGNEAVAIFRIRVGREIGSAALIADGYHARTDGWTSLAVLVGAIGVWLGYPIADPIVGILITAAIMVIVWQSGKAVFTRLLDGVDPEVIDEIRHTAGHVPGVEEVAETRARWLGHRLRAEVNIVVSPECSVEEGHGIAREVNHRLLHELRYLDTAVIHVDPVQEAGEKHHRIPTHTHDGLPPHSH